MWTPLIQPHWLLCFSLSISTICVVLCASDAVSAQEKGEPPASGGVFAIIETKVLDEAAALSAEVQGFLLKTDSAAKDNHRTELFRQFRSYRNQLGKKSAAVRTLVESVAQLKSSWQQQINNLRIKDDTALTRLILRYPDLATRLDDGTSAAGDGPSDTASGGQALPGSGESFPGETLAELKKAVEQRRTELKKYDEQIKAWKESEGRKEQIRVLQQNLNLAEQIARNGQTLLRALDDLTTKLEDASQDLLDIDSISSSYTNWSTIVFAFLVGGVMLGFFWVTLKSEIVRDKIFSGDAGIQFITLFSLVIAIILFGVLKILEGKELSALLGGLSGYILGRGSRSAISNPDAPADRAAPAEAPRP